MAGKCGAIKEERWAYPYVERAMIVIFKEMLEDV